MILVVAGCRLPGSDGPVPRALVTSRMYSQQAVGAMERSQWDQAEQLLGKAVTACPMDPEARRHYAEVLWQRGAKAEAIAQLDQVGRLVRDDAGVVVRMAEMRLAVGQLDAARYYAERAISLDAKLASGWAIRGRVMRASGDVRQALADFHRALGLSPDDRQVLFEVAQLYREQNLPDRALISLQTLCDTYAPGEEPPQVLQSMGLTYAALGRHADAAEQLALAVNRGPPSADLLAQLADAQRMSGQAAAAAASAREALLLDPQHRLSQELLANLDGPAAAVPVRR